MTNLVVDPISAASPDLDHFEFQALKDSIAQIGQLVPILVRDGKVIDGRKRMAACEALGIELKSVEMASDADPAKQAEALNLLRTHYTPSQRAMFASTMATLRRGSNRFERKVDAGIPSSTTEAHAAASLGVERSSVTLAKKIRRMAAPEVVQAVESGHLTLHAAEKITVGVPKERQADAVERVTAIDGKRKQTAKILEMGGKTVHRSPKVPANEKRQRAIWQVDEACKALEALTDAEIVTEQPKQWMAIVEHSIATLRRFRAQLEDVYGKRRTRA